MPTYARGSVFLLPEPLLRELGIFRIPVLNAYAQLLAEGYFASRKGAGTFISDALPETLTSCKDRPPRLSQQASGPRPIAQRPLLLSPYKARAFGLGGRGALAFISRPLITFPLPSGRA